MKKLFPQPFGRLFGLAILGLAIFMSSCETQDVLYPTLEEVNTLEGKPNHIPGSFIVILEENSINFRKSDTYEDAQAGMRKISEDLVAKYGITPQQIDKVYGNLLTGFSATLSPAQAAALRQDPKVESIEEDGIVYANNEVVQSPATWGIDRIDQTARPLSNSYSYAQTGQGVKAFILDTGIKYDHPDFEGRAIQGYSGYNDNGSDVQGHGTHVAGTVGSKTYGVAKKATLVSVKVLSNTGSGSWATVIAGMDWVVANKGTSPSVVNMSLGGGGTSSSMNTAVKKLFDAKVPVIVAAGNDNKDAKDFTPANAPNAYAVGASTSTDARASFSNFGSTVKIFAPGASITSTAVNGGTATYNGTSMASPHVAGVAALLLQTNPAASAQQIYDMISSNATKGVITVNASSTTTDLLYSKSNTVIDTTPTPITLEATWKKVSNRVVVNLTFTGITSSRVDIYRNNTKLTKTNTGTYEDKTNFTGSGSIKYRVCAAGTTNCSSTITVDYK